MPPCLLARDDVAVWRTCPDTYTGNIQPGHVDHLRMVRARCAWRTVYSGDVRRCETDGRESVNLWDQPSSREILRCRTDLAAAWSNAFWRLLAIKGACISELHRLAIK